MPSPRCWPQPDAAHLLVTGAEMAALEERLFNSGLPIPALMEKAALALSAGLLRRLQDGSRPSGACAGWRAGDGVLVLVGPGHNGGDGLVVARELSLAGVPVRIWSPFERHKPLCEAHLRHALWLGIPRLAEPPDPADPALWLDALFGIGQSRAPGDPLESLLEERQRQRPGMLAAVDGPTGLCADSGRLLGRGGATAALTWSIGLIKRGFVQDRALARVGELERLDLGLPPMLLAELPPSTPLGLWPQDEAAAPWLDLDPAAGKYGRGRALVVAGSRRYRGAAALALAGASASGCGSLRAVVPEELTADLWQRQPHVVLEASLPSDPGGALCLEGLAEYDLARLDALLLGPGLGLPVVQGEVGVALADGPAAAAVWERLRAFDGLLVLDADGLNRLARRCGGQVEGGSSWLARRQGPTWITPHRGEFNRLFPQWADAEPLQAAAAAAAASGATVLLKGARTVVATPDGRLRQVLQASSAAARAGLGDTLAGYAVGCGAMALAAQRGGDWPELDGVLLAAVALAHAEAGRRARSQRGAGGATPQAVARELARVREGLR